MPVFAERDNDAALATLLRRRDEVEAWLDGPAKNVTLTAIERDIRRALRGDVGAQAGSASRQRTDPAMGTSPDHLSAATLGGQAPAVQPPAS